MSNEAVKEMLIDGFDFDYRHWKLMRCLNNCPSDTLDFNSMLEYSLYNIQSAVDDGAELDNVITNTIDSINNFFKEVTRL